MLGAAANYSRGVAVQFGLEEQEGVPTVAPELVPVSDIHQRPEQWALHGGSLLHGALQNGVIAGERSYVQIQPGTGELVIIEGMWVETTAQYLWVTTNAAMDTSTGNLFARDARVIVTAGGSARSGTRLRRNSAAASGIMNSITAAFVAGVYYPLDIVLVDPIGWAIGPQAVATTTGLISFKVRSRPATPRELQAGPGGAL